MFKFLRSIRKNLLNEGKTTKYFKYAIGEIVLVVIGILIALQINNWNENRKDGIKENQIVKSLYNEFLENSDYIDRRVQNLSTINGTSSKSLLWYCNENYTDISADSLITLIKNTWLALPAYAPMASTFTRIINNEEFNLIQQDSLKILLNQYKSILDFTFITNNMLLDYEIDFWSYAQDKFGAIPLGKKINVNYTRTLFDTIVNYKASFDPNDIVSDTAFENILTKNTLYLGYAMNRLNELQEHNKTIRGYIDKHYRF